VPALFQPSPILQAQRPSVRLSTLEHGNASGHRCRDRHCVGERRLRQRDYTSWCASMGKAGWICRSQVSSGREARKEAIRKGRPKDAWDRPRCRTLYRASVDTDDFDS
jgi:hypothetical protein